MAERRTLILNNEEECKQIRDSESPRSLKGWKRMANIKNDKTCQEEQSQCVYIIQFKELESQGQVWVTLNMNNEE